MRKTDQTPTTIVSTRLRTLLMTGVLLFLSTSMVAMAADYYPPRVSHVEGSAAYVPAGDVDWEEVTANLPLLNGDRLVSHPDSKIEIEVGRGNFVRLWDNTDVAFNRTSEDDTDLQLYGGDLVVRVNRSERFRVFTPAGVVEIRKKGLYRLSVLEGNATEVFVRKGQVDIKTDAGSKRLKTGQYVMLDGTERGLANVVFTANLDDFDLWSDRRDARYVNSQSVQYVGGTHYPGVYDLDYYGDWVVYPSYGRVWVPHAAFSVGWAPYRLGRWGYLSFGWTWISYEPWGWLPYHHGQWVYYEPYSRWCWMPGSFHHWSPALVDFYWGHGYVGWSPRGYYNRTMVNNNTTIINNNTIINQWDRPGGRHGLTVARMDEFGQGRRDLTQIRQPNREMVQNLRNGFPTELSDRARTRAIAARGGSGVESRNAAMTRQGSSVTRGSQVQGNAAVARGTGSIGRTNESSRIRSVTVGSRGATGNDALRDQNRTATRGTAPATVGTYRNSRTERERLRTETSRTTGITTVRPPRTTDSGTVRNTPSNPRQSSPSTTTPTYRSRTPRTETRTVQPDNNRFNRGSVTGTSPGSDRNTVVVPQNRTPTRSRYQTSPAGSRPSSSQPRTSSRPSYSQPRTNSGPSYSAPRQSSRPNYSSPRPSSSRPSYSAPRQSAPSRPSYSAPRQSAPSRPSYSAPRQPAPSRPSYSAPRQSAPRPSYSAPAPSSRPSGSSRPASRPGKPD